MPMVLLNYTFPCKVINLIYSEKSNIGANGYLKGLYNKRPISQATKSDIRPL